MYGHQLGELTFRILGVKGLSPSTLSLTFSKSFVVVRSTALCSRFLAVLDCEQSFSFTHITVRASNLFFWRKKRKKEIARSQSRCRLSFHAWRTLFFAPTSHVALLAWWAGFPLPKPNCRHIVLQYSLWVYMERLFIVLYADKHDWDRDYRP